MTRFPPLALGLAMPVALFSTAAFADLTPAQVWGDWRTYLEGMGYQINATQSVSGDDLTVSDISLNFQMPEDGSMNMTLGTIRFDQNRDGTVAIILPDTMPITMSGKDSGPSGEEFTMTLNYSQTGHAMTASGSPEEMTYLYTAQTIAMDLVQMQVGNEALGEDMARVKVAGSNLETTTTLSIGDMREYTQSGSLDSLTYDFSFIDPEQPNTQGAVTGSVTGVTMNGAGIIPLDVPDAADMAAMLEAGFDVSGGFSYTGGSSNFDMKDPESGNYVMATSSDGGELSVDMGADGLASAGAQKNVNVAVTAEGMPFPFEIAMAESGFNLAMPVSKSDEAQDFAFGLTLGSFTMSDMIWSMFDPAGQLPRDPATLVLDLAGKAKLLVDWMNPDAAAQMGGAPGEVEALQLNTLVVDAAGAKLEGSGDVTFDGAGPSMVPGMGNPVGDVNLTLNGGNGLLDKLVAMGLLPQDQAMGARMMMGLFAVPGTEPDSLKSRIEFTQDGQILANGQRIR